MENLENAIKQKNEFRRIQITEEVFKWLKDSFECEDYLDFEVAFDNWLDDIPAKEMIERLVLFMVHNKNLKNI